MSKVSRSNRFIVVQGGSCALFGVFTLPADGDLGEAAIASLDSCVRDEAENPLIFTTATAPQNALHVYAVPSEIKGFDERDIDAGSTQRGRIFEGFSSWNEVGAIVEDDEDDEASNAY